MKTPSKKSAEKIPSPNAQTDPNILRAIAADETFSAETTVRDQNTVFTKYAVRRSDKSPRYEKETVFDFSGCSREDLMVLAMYGCKVKIQSNLRSLSEEEFLKSTNYAKVDVFLEIVNAERRQTDPITNAIRALMKAAGIDEKTARAIVEQAGNNNK